MGTIYEPKEIEKILSEADELLYELNFELIKDMEEAQRSQVETYFDQLKKRRLEVQEKTEKGKTSGYDTYGEGIHKAIDDIVTAMKALTRFLS